MFHGQVKISLSTKVALSFLIVLKEIKIKTFWYRYLNKRKTNNLFDYNTRNFVK